MFDCLSVWSFVGVKLVVAFCVCVVCLYGLFVCFCSVVGLRVVSCVAHLCVLIVCCVCSVHVLFVVVCL